MRTIAGKITGNNYLIVWEVISIDFVFIILFIIGFMLIVELISYSSAGRLLKILEKYNLGIWMLQALFFTPNLTFQHIAYMGKYPVIIYVFTISILLLLSMLAEYPYSVAFKTIKKKLQ